MTHLKSKISYVVGSFIAGLIVSACAEGIVVKVYRLNFERGGLVRSQAKEIIEFKQANGFYCLNPKDTRALLEDYKACQRLCK